MKPLLAALCVCVFAYVGTTYAIADSDQPDPDTSQSNAFSPNLDTVCAHGQTMSEGCDAIRSREIVNATAAPWRAIGRVNFASTQIRQHCTGTLVAERVVLTAAHCLYNSPRKTWIPPQSIVFVAGFQRGSGMAISRGERFILDGAEDTGSRHFRATPNRDWALLVLEEPIGQDVGYLKVSSIDPDAEHLEWVLAGYSGLRPNVLSLASDCGQPLDGPAGVLLQSCSTMTGDSGAPLLIHRDGTYYVAGVFSSIVSWSGGYASLSIPTDTFIDALHTASGQDDTE